MEEHLQENYLLDETRLALVRRLAQFKYDLEETIFSILWANVSDQLSEVLVRHNISVEQLDQPMIHHLMGQAADAIKNGEVLPWKLVMQEALEEALPEEWRVEPDLDIEPDEGPLVEQFENATRLGDDEAYFGGYNDDFFGDC